MTEEIEFILDHTKEQMEKALTHLDSELLKIRAGKASTQVLDGIYVDYYGSSSSLSNVSSISIPDARTIVIQPWEKSMLTPIERAIQAANLGFNPQNDGSLIRINIPPLTEERRKSLVKNSKTEGENAKVSIRSIRRETNEAIKKLQKDGLPEDMAKDAENKTQSHTDAYIAKIDILLDKKEKDIMTV